MLVLRRYIFPILLLLLIANCRKKKKTPERVMYPPEIELLSVTPYTVKEFKDTVIIVVKYKDANGDLGDENPDELSLEVKDSRLPKADAYHVQPLAPVKDEDIPIEGELRIRLNSMFLIGGGTSEQTVLTIKIKDRAGNWSNEVQSQTININK